MATIRVIAKQKGAYKGIRYPGAEFVVEESQFNPSWMQALDPLPGKEGKAAKPPKPAKPAQQPAQQPAPEPSGDEPPAASGDEPPAGGEDADLG